MSRYLLFRSSVSWYSCWVSSRISFSFPYSSSFLTITLSFSLSICLISSSNDGTSHFATLIRLVAPPTGESGVLSRLIRPGVVRSLLRSERCRSVIFDSSARLAVSSLFCRSVMSVWWSDFGTMSIARVLSFASGMSGTSACSSCMVLLSGVGAATRQVSVGIVMSYGYSRV